MLSSKCKFVIKSEKLLHINVEYISHFQVAKDFLELACLHLSSDGVGLVQAAPTKTECQEDSLHTRTTTTRSKPL